jgi:hypothetical protein
VALVLLIIAMILPFGVRQKNFSAGSGAVALVILLHQLASFYHCYYQHLPTVSTDSEGFVYSARNLETSRLRGMFYIQLLGNMYKVFGFSHLMSCELTQVAFSLTIVTLLLLFRKAEARPGLQSTSLLVFGLLPSCLLTTAVPMREAFQMAGFLILIYGILQLRCGRIIDALVLIPVGTVWLLLFHKGFAVFLLASLPIAILWAVGASFGRLLSGLAASFVVLYLFGDSLWGLMLEKSASLQHLVQGDGIEYIDQYADQVMEGRTEFDVNLELDSMGSFLSTAPVIYLYYLFSPFPWQVRGALDIVGVFESFVRMYLLYQGFKGYLRTSGEARKTQGFLLMMFLLMEATWAAGTANWGTAIRHRLVAWPVLVLLGAQGLSATDTENPTEVTRPQSKREKVRELRRKRKSETMPDERSP